MYGRIVDARCYISKVSRSSHWCQLELSSSGPRISCLATPRKWLLCFPRRGCPVASLLAISTFSATKRDTVRSISTFYILQQLLRSWNFRFMILSTTESNAQVYNWSSRTTFARQVFTISVEMVNPQYPPTTFLKPLTTLRNYFATSCKVISKTGPTKLVPFSLSLKHWILISCQIGSEKHDSTWTHVYEHEVWLSYAYNEPFLEVDHLPYISIGVVYPSRADTRVH